MDPVTAGSFLSGLKSFGSSAGPSSATGGTSPFDGSGWNTNYGSGSIDSARSAGSLDPYMPYLLIAAGVLVAWRLTRK